MREYYRRKGGNPNRTTYQIHCGECAAEVTTTSKRTRYCQACASRRAYEAAGKAHRERALKLAPLRALNRLPVHVGPLNTILRYLPARHPARVQQPKRRIFCSGPCAWCGDHFTIVDQLQARYCSKQCLARAAQAKARAKIDSRFRPSPAERRRIYERDNWICQLCGDPVDRGLHPSDPWAATLDHIICQSWSDEPDHSPGNLRLAHRWCNSVRGDERFYTADVLAP